MDCLEGLKSLSDNSVDCCVTSPPYFGLRDYGFDDQIGHEPHYSDYIYKLVTIFRELRRVLKSDGSLWLNLGDIAVRLGTVGIRGFSHER
ncbi:MAG: site-specific DNA-methyltransferase [Proteobacteria bacterium]|nr:site-specific DNA-methyltransferase [Pseudomonadota bacterium]MBU1612580.1 site-specific DNA-methyltransferase [Pseudomonadota bacterium]